MMTSYFIAIDGDDVGPAIRDFIVNNDVKGASDYSINLRNFFQEISNKLETLGAVIVFLGGDSVLAKLDSPPNAIEFETFYFGPCTISIGIGNSPEIAYLALQLAKARGKNQVVLIDGINSLTIYHN